MMPDAAKARRKIAAACLAFEPLRFRMIPDRAAFALIFL
jgi:hypothetical protein